MRRFCYPVNVRRNPGGGYVVTVPDVPEAITQGDSIEEALEQAADALEEAVAGRIRLKLPIPMPSEAKPRQHVVTLPVETATKAALYMTLRESGLSNIEAAARLGIDEKEVRRLIDPYHPSKLPRIEAALAALGKKLVLVIRDAADRRQVPIPGRPPANAARRTAGRR